MADDAHEKSPNIAISNIQRPEGGTSAGLTELEGVILGILWSRQPCSPYVVMKRFQRSPTWGWSSSSGAIYPAIARLKRRGLIDHRPTSTGKRNGELLSLSAAGEQILRGWISGLAEEMGSAGLDPIRTRVNYLGALAPAQRMRFIARAEEVTKARLQIAEDMIPDSEGRGAWCMAATRSALVHQLEARLRWLQELKELVARHGEG